MKYIKTYESFKSSRYDKVDEGILGKLFGKLKDKLSLGFSKKFGTASKVDKLMEEYKEEIMKAEVDKKNILKQYAEYIKSIKDGGDKSDDMEKKFQKNYEVAEKNYDSQLEIIKKKFDLKFNEVIKEESNEKIKNYVTLKKLELQQELLKNQLTIVLTDTGLSEDDIKDDPFFKKLSDSIQSKTEENIKMQEEEKNQLTIEGDDETDKFDIEKAKSDDNYKWEKSPYLKGDINVGTELSYFSKTNKDATTGWAVDKKDSDGDDMIRITTKKDKPEDSILINRDRIISVK